MAKRAVFLIGLFIAISGFCSAQSLSLNETALEILTKSPAYRLEKYSLESVISGLKTSSNLPDPEIGGEYLVAPIKDDNRWALELTWGLEWPGVYKARCNEAKAKMNLAQLELNGRSRDKLADIKDLLLDYIRTQKKLQLLEELSHNNDTIYHLAEQAARGGEMTLLDLNKVKLEYANIRVGEAALMDEKAKIIGELSQIYGEDCSYLLEKMDCRFPKIILPTSEEIEEIKKNAPAVIEAEAETMAARKSSAVSKMEALPSLSIGYKHAFEDGMHFNGALLGISIPIFSSRGKQKAIKAETTAAEFKAEVAAREIEMEALTTVKHLEIIDRQIKEIAPIVENSDYNSALLKAYQGGVITLIEYISDRNYFTNAALELVTLRHNAAKTLIYLQRYIDSID